MEINAQNLEQALCQFYHSSQNNQVEAHEWLTQVQRSQQAWIVLWDLLNPVKSSEIQFFAATTLHLKLSRDWKQVPLEDYETLKRKILDAVLCYAAGPKVVFNRLCIALACFILRTVQNFWKTPISDILSLFQNTSAIPPEKAAWVVLEILTVIPEEFQTIPLTQTEKLQVRHELESSVTLVTSLVDTILQQTDESCIKQSVKCASAWFQMGVPIPSCEPLFSHLIQIALASWSNESSELCEITLEALTHSLTNPISYKYTSSLMGLIHKTMPLETIAENLQHISTSGQFTENNQELLTSIYSLFITVGETHTRLFLQGLLSEDKQERETFFKIIRIVLNCSNAPGEFPIHETYSSSTFSFWYILQDEVVNQPPENYTKLSENILAVYKSLVEILLKKSSFSEGYSSWSNEDKEKFRCYRTDIADTLLYCQNILREELLELLLFKMKQYLCGGDIKAHWQPLEAIIHAFYAIAEDINISSPNKLVHSFFEIIKSLPLGELDSRIAITVLDAIGAYAEWIYVNNEVMSDILPLLIAGLNHMEAAPSATMALKDIMRDCAPALHPYAPHILLACQRALSAGNLKLSECARLMYTIGKVLTVLPEQTVIDTILNFVQPYVQKLTHLSQSKDKSAVVRDDVIFVLRLISSLLLGLESSEKEYTPPPIILELLKSLLPVFNNVVNEWYADTTIIEILCHCLKFGAITLHDVAAPLVPTMLNLVILAHKLNPNKSTLDLTRQFLLLYGKNKQLQSYLDCVICEFINHTMTLYTKQDIVALSEHCDVLEMFFQVIHALMKKNCPAVVENENIDFETLFLSAITTLNVQEAPTIKAVSSFLVVFIGMSREKRNMVNAVQNRGQLLVYTLIRCIGIVAPRASLEHLSEIVLSLNKKYCDNLYRWLTVVLAEENFPTERATAEVKQQFMKIVLKERTNKRKLQEIVTEFALYCRGVVTSTPFTFI